MNTHKIKKNKKSKKNNIKSSHPPSNQFNIISLDMFFQLKNKKLPQIHIPIKVSILRL
jgi:hypothetical protein